MGDFLDKSSSNFSQEMLNSLSFGYLFKPGFYNNGINSNYINSIDINNLLTANPILFNTIESFKNISRSMNMNFPFNNNVFIYIKISLIPLVMILMFFRKIITQI
jgi:hypothetical protein